MSLHWLRSEQQIYLDDSSNLLLFSAAAWEWIPPLSGLCCTVGCNLRHICRNQNASGTYRIDVAVDFLCGVKK